VSSAHRLRDLRHFPLDEQTLFNAKAASDRIVYVVDRQSFDKTGAPSPPPRGPCLVVTTTAGVASQ
jgi:hypothetical protein